MSAIDDRRTVVRGLIEREPELGQAKTGSGAWLRGMCALAVRALPASGVGVSVMSGRSGGPSLTTASDRVSREAEDLQFVMGEGPCLEAYASRRPVLVADLSLEQLRRWPAYAPAAHDLGVRAVFAFPMRVGSARLGVLDVYRDQTGPLSAVAVVMAEVFAEQALTSLLDGQRAAADGDSLDPVGDGVGDALHHRLEVYQAQGMVQVQLGVSPDEAMLRIRAHAFAAGLTLTEVAADIVSRRLRLDLENDRDND